MSLQKTRQKAVRAGVDGFTLIELLIVVVIIGILAAIAIPQFSNTKDQAQLGKMRSDLRNMVPAQEAYFVDENTYTSTLADLEGYSASPGVTVSITTATDTGWAATADHSAVDDQCGVAVGEATNPVADTTSGVVICQ